MSFYSILQHYNWDEVTQAIYSKTEEDVLRALQSNRLTTIDFMALVSPAAEGFLEQMAQKSHALTRQRFGNIIQLYIPIYLSNFCENGCLYCGFSSSNKITRTKLSLDELLSEASKIKQHPFKHILLVSGEAPKKAGADYFLECIEKLRSGFSQISLEVQPLTTNEYKRLINGGLHSVYIYQETYHEQRYSFYHPSGPKADFRFRLETPERLGDAGIRKIGLGTLIGLEDWRTEAFFTILHLSHLRKKYWQTAYSISFPRLRPFVGNGFLPDYPATEKSLVQLICAYRIFDPEVDLSLSTRESPLFRNHAMNLGITTMSAGSKTAPGGYSGMDALEQFSVHDNRAPHEVARAIKAIGLEPVWKDWSLSLQTTAGQIN